MDNQMSVVANPVHRGDPTITSLLPYSFSLYGVNISGVFYFKDPLELCYTDGVVSGAAHGTYHLDRDEAYFDSDDGITPVIVRLRLDFKRRVLECEGCVRVPFEGRKCTGWKPIISW